MRIYIRSFNSLLKLVMITICMVFSSLFFGVIGYAEEQSSFGYSVIFPENQIQKEIGYYHLKMSPSQKQTVQIEFTNTGNKKVTVKISLNGAKTNSNGVIEYGNSNIKNDASLKFDFKDIVSAPDKVELAVGETKTIDFNIEMPETSYDGVIAGGIELLQEGQDKVDKQSNSMVINEYAYVVGMLLQETDKKITPKLKLNTVRPGQANYKNTVYVEYSNTSPEFVNNMTTEVQISKKGEQFVRYERKQSKMRMAPNSFISFPVLMNGEKMEPGNYTATILVSADKEINERWEYDFEITQDEADKFNERDVGLEQEASFDWKIIAIAIIGFFLLVIVLFLVISNFKKNKNKKNLKAKKSKRKDR